MRNPSKYGGESLAIVSTNHVIPYLAHVLLVDVNMDI
jgi:hypothetical protein